MANTTNDSIQQAYQTSYAQIVDKVWGPVFFRKLASDYGVTPQTEEQAQKLVMMAERLRHAHSLEQQKQASASTSLLDRAATSLNSLLEDNGVPVHDTEVQNATKQAAANLLASDPTLKNAALLYQDFLAQSLAQQG